MNCTECLYAEWQRTEAGRLHPSGDGQCKYPYKVPPLPSAMYWITLEAKPSGGWINRRKELGKDCPYFTRVPQHTRGTGENPTP